jgi:hypothetical protein
METRGVTCGAPVTVPCGQDFHRYEPIEELGSRGKRLPEIKEEKRW